MLSFAPRRRQQEHPGGAGAPAMATLIELAPIADEMQRVDDLVRRRLASDVPLVRQVAQYIVAGGGKRLRPALLLLSAGAAGYRGEAHLELATVIEFIHTATLLHDDVVDDAGIRRGVRRQSGDDDGAQAA